MLLSVEALSVCYGKAPALRDVTIEVAEGEVVAIVGANGAGKTTLLRSVSALVRPQSGRVFLVEARIDGLEPDEVTRLGIAHAPEGKQLFPDLSVKDNLLMGAYLIRDRQRIVQNMEKMFTVFPILKTRQAQRAESLSGGEQQILAIARALMCEPKLLLLDEPTLGLAPLVVNEMGQLITRLRDTGVSILLVEQNARFAFALASRGYVLDTGRVTLQGPVASLRQAALVQHAYLGA